MHVEQLQINSLEEALKILKQALDKKLDDSKSYELIFGDWLNFNFKVTGDKYKSTLPASSLKALAQYQAAINSFCASLVYGKTAQSLTDEDKRELELIFHFSEGSSVTNAPLNDVVESLGSKAIEKMNGNQLVLTVLGLALIAGAYFGISNYIDAGSKQHAADSNERIVQLAIESSIHLSKINADITNSALGLVKSVSDADSIELGNITLSSRDIPEYVRRDRSQRNHDRIDGMYRVTRISEADSDYRIGLERKDGFSVIASMPMDGANSARIFDALLESMASKSATHLQIVAKTQHGATVDAAILTGDVQDRLLFAQEEIESQE